MSDSTVQGCLADAEHDREVPEIDLLTPLTLRGVELRRGLDEDQGRAADRAAAQVDQVPVVGHPLCESPSGCAA